jgi:hypothetical protein
MGRTCGLYSPVTKHIHRSSELCTSSGEERDYFWTRQATYDVILRCVHATDFAVEVISNTYSEHVCVASRMQCGMRHIFICGLSGSVLYFSTLSHKRYEFRKKVTEYKMCVLIFSTTFVCCLKHFSFYEEMSEILLKICICLHVKYPLFLSDFNEIWISSIVFRKVWKRKISWKSVQWEPSCSMRTDGKTDERTRHDEANIRLSIVRIKQHL